MQLKSTSPPAYRSPPLHYTCTDILPFLLSILFSFIPYITIAWNFSKSTQKRTRIEDEDENMVNRKRRRRRAGCWELRKIQWPIVLMWYLSSELRAERERERGEEIVRGIWAKTEMNKWEEAGKKEIYIKCVYCNHLKRKEQTNIYIYIYCM